MGSLDLLACCAVGVVKGFGPEDIAAHALAKAVHATFFLRLARGEGDVGAVAAEGNADGVRIFGVVVYVWLKGFGAMICGLVCGWHGGCERWVKGVGAGAVGLDRGMETSFGVFVLEALDHPFEGGVKEQQTFW